MAIAGESNVVTQGGSHPGGSAGDPVMPDFGQPMGMNANQPAIAGVTPSKLSPDGLFEVLKGWFKADAQHSGIWRTEAKEDYDFRAGDQWTPEDRALLNAQQRPHIVFNRLLTILKAVAGMEINGRHQIEFLPVNSTQTEVNELLTSASVWMGHGCDAEDEESEAFEDCATCGMGWTEARLDFEETSRGKYIEERIDPIEMYWDRTCKKKNIVDARRMHRVRKMPLGDAMQIFPGYTKEQLDAVWAIGNELDEAKKTLEEKRKREENTTDVTYDDQYEVTIIHSQWWEREHYWLVADPQSNNKTELTDQQWRSFETRMRMLGMEPVGVKLTRRVYHQAFLGGQMLKSEPAPIKGRFSWACITGEKNRTKGTFFGLTRVARDPQMWANKWLSQSLHILNTTAKGGIMAEKSAFVDERQAEDSYARPDVITWVEEKAISGDKPKIMPKPGGQFPQGHMDLMQFAISAIRDVTGINLELLGQKDINQPGILEAMRKQAGMTVLATLFDSLRRYRKLVGRQRLFFLQNFFNDGRLIRVVGPDGAAALPLLRDKCLGEYDVIVDDAPTSPNQKEANWAVIQPFLLAFKDILVQKPQLLGIILEYSPLPARLVKAVNQVLASAGQQQPSPMEMLQIRNLMAEIAKKNAQANQANATAGKQQSSSIWDVASAKEMIAGAAHKMAEIPGLHADAASTLADAENTRADTLNTHADTLSKHVERHADALNTHADTLKKHAERGHAHVKAVVDALTPIPDEPPQPAQPGT